jgi:hypothetical protein
MSRTRKTQVAPVTQVTPVAQVAQVKKSRRVHSSDKKLNLTEAWFKVLNDNFQARLSDSELESAFLKLMGGNRKKAQPAARIRGFFNSPKFPYFIQLAHLTQPAVKLPQFVDKKPVGRKTVVEAFVKAYGTADEKKALKS